MPRHTVGVLENDRVLFAERFAENQPVCIVPVASAQRHDASTVERGINDVGLNTGDGSDVVVGTSHGATYRTMGRRDKTQPSLVLNPVLAPQSLACRSRDRHVRLSAAMVTPTDAQSRTRYAT